MIRRRLVAALAALVATAVAVLVPAAPASAEPRLCTVEEWRDPGNLLDPSKYLDCARGLQEDLTNRAQCLNPPMPTSPTSGTAGWLATRPDSDLRSGVPGMWSKYGVAGYPFELYDVSCIPSGVAAPVSTGKNEAASLIFSLAVANVALTNRLRTVAYEPEQTWAWSDSFVKESHQALYEHIFVTGSVIAMMIVAFYIMWRAREGQMSDAARTAMFGVMVIAGMTLLAQWPVTATHYADKVATSTMSTIHSVVGPAKQDAPPEQCRALSPDACQDHRTAATRASDTATEALLYRSWLRAMLGSDTSPTAQQYGKALYNATAFTWDDAKAIEQDPAHRAVIVDQKREQFMSIAERIKKEDPEAYEHLRGVRGNDRIGAAVAALLASLAFTPFDLAASALIFLGFMVIRIAVVVAPLAATPGVFRLAAGLLTRVVNSVLVSIFNIVVFGAAAGLYLKLADWLLRNDAMPQVVALFVIAAMGVGLWILLRPARQLLGSFGRVDANSRGLGWLRRTDQPAAAAPGGDPAPAPASPGPTGPATVRPESHTAPPPRQAPPRTPPQSAPAPPPPSAARTVIRTAATAAAKSAGVPAGAIPPARPTSPTVPRRNP